MTEQQAEQQLKDEGFINIYVWQDGPSTYFSDRKHKTDSAHIILEGDISVTLKENTEIYKRGDRFDVQAGEEYSARSGSVGCRCITGEK